MRNKRKHEKIEMYDMMLANLVAGSSIIEPIEKLDSSRISIGFSNISSETHLIKYYVINGFPDYIQPQILDTIRKECISNGVKVNYYIYGQPHEIRWNSAEMRNKMGIWKKYSEEQAQTPDVFEYRSKRDASIVRDRIIWSTKYLNEAELDHKRTLMKVIFLVEISSKRDEESIINIAKSIESFKKLCKGYDIKYRELKVNLIDWLSYFGIFSLKQIKEVAAKVSKKVLTDDLLANFNGYKQGQIGYEGVPLGIDVFSKLLILYKFKADPDAPENWLIAGETGSGKSMFVKVLLTYLLASKFVVTVMDYEGDEYYKLANYIRASNTDDVKIISAGKGSTVYFDPMEIPDLTGDNDIDDELKEVAIGYIEAVFKIIISGPAGETTQWEDKVVSNAIKRVYERAGVTDDKTTWVRSKGLRLLDVYNEIKQMVDSKELVDDLMDNIIHKAAVRILTSASTYFEEGEAKSGTFKQPMSVNELYKAKLIIFSFGMKGATSSQTDSTILALKQLSVANIAMQISNYCRYIKKCFNVKVWEEYQRWGEVKGSSELIVNAMTGGRKRGDVNLMITNNLADILDEDNKVAQAIRQNLQTKVIGKIIDAGVRKRFCEVYDLNEMKPSLDLIAKATSGDTESKKRKADKGYTDRYKHAFMLVLPNGKKAITKVMLPKALRDSQIFRAGIDITD